jgi:hypothetical protein
MFGKLRSTQQTQPFPAVWIESPDHYHHKSEPVFLSRLYLYLHFATSHMFMINHNLDVQVFPSSLKRSPLPEPTPAPGWFGDLTSVVGNGIGQATSVVGAGVGQLTTAIGNGASSAAQAVTSIISSASSQLSSILVPDYIDASTTNSVASIIANSNGCAPYSGGKATSFVLLDFVDIGEGMKAVDILNGLA